MEYKQHFFSIVIYFYSSFFLFSFQDQDKNSLIGGEGGNEENPQPEIPENVQVSMVNPLLHTPILGSSDLAANKDMMSKTLTDGDTIS